MSGGIISGKVDDTTVEPIAATTDRELRTADEPAAAALAESVVLLREIRDLLTLIAGQF